MVRRPVFGWLGSALSCLLLVSLHAQQDQPEWKAASLASFDDVWQTINEKFYDPTFGGVDWSAVRAELRVKAEAATSPDAVRQVITEMLARMKTSHFTLLPSGGPEAESRAIGPAAVPIEVRVSAETIPGAGPGPFLIVTRVEPGSDAEKAGLRPGQIVRQIDGADVATWITAVTPGGDARARDFEAWRQAMRALHGDDGSVAVLRVGTGGSKTTDVRSPRVIDAGQVVRLGNLPPLLVHVDVHAALTPHKRTVGVIAFNVWLPQIDQPVADAVDKYRGADGLVIDLRGNPGGVAAMIQGLAGHLMTDGTAVVGRMHTRDGDLVFHPNPRLSTTDGRGVTPYSGPVAVLVDELTGSASECFAGGLQSLGRVRVFGRQTMGAALPASTKRLPNGDVLMFVVGDFVTSTGRRVEGAGVMPDQSVRLTVESLRAGHDPDLEAALAWFDRVKR
jgi:carboxyl-terminal processing protease